MLLIRRKQLPIFDDILKTKFDNFDHKAVDTEYIAHRLLFPLQYKFLQQRHWNASNLAISCYIF